MASMCSRYQRHTLHNQPGTNRSRALSNHRPKARGPATHPCLVAIQPISDISTFNGLSCLFAEASIYHDNSMCQMGTWPRGNFVKTESIKIGII